MYFGWIQAPYLDIGRPDAETSSVSWRIHSHDSHSSSLEIVVYPFLLQTMPVPVRWMPHLVRLRPRLTGYLESVLGGFEWFITRGEPVPRNQFGTHPWFS